MCQAGLASETIINRQGLKIKPIELVVVFILNNMLIYEFNR